VRARQLLGAADEARRLQRQIAHPRVDRGRTVLRRFVVFHGLEAPCLVGNQSAPPRRTGWLMRCLDQDRRGCADGQRVVSRLTAISYPFGREQRGPADAKCSQQQVG
jgi:hypothetical protein